MPKPAVYLSNGEKLDQYSEFVSLSREMKHSAVAFISPREKKITREWNRNTPYVGCTIKLSLYFWKKKKDGEKYSPETTYLSWNQREIGAWNITPRISFHFGNLSVSFNIILQRLCVLVSTDTRTSRGASMFFLIMFVSYSRYSAV